MVYFGFDRGVGVGVGIGRGVEAAGEGVDGGLKCGEYGYAMEYRV